MCELRNGGVHVTCSEMGPFFNGAAWQAAVCFVTQAIWNTSICISLKLVSKLADLTLSLPPVGKWDAFLQTCTCGLCWLQRCFPV
jgi:hypothetical protein